MGSGQYCVEPEAITGVEQDNGLNLEGETPDWHCFGLFNRKKYCHKWPRPKIRWIATWWATSLLFWLKRQFRQAARKSRNWIFAVKEAGNGEEIRLVKEADMPIRRHIKIRTNANPHNPVWDKYFVARKEQMRKSTPWNCRVPENTLVEAWAGWGETLKSGS